MDLRVSFEGRVLALPEISPRATIHDLKLAIHAMTRVPVEAQQLAFAGEALDDDTRTVRSHHLHTGASAKLVLVSRHHTPAAFAATSDGLTVTLPVADPAAAAALNHRLRRLDTMHDEMLHRVKRVRPVVMMPSKEAKPVDAKPVDAALLGYQVALKIFGMGHLIANGPTLLVCGGVHGNETRGMDGVRALQDLCSAAANPLVREVLSRARVVTVPCLNRVGHLANARGCPKRGTEVAQCADGKVWVAPDERGGIKYAEGWSDPNRGWGDTNQTVAMAVLQELLGSSMTRPSVAIFNHDWALPQGKCYNIGCAVGQTNFYSMAITYGYLIAIRLLFGGYSIAIQLRYDCDAIAIRC